MSITRKKFFKGLALGTIAAPFVIRSVVGKTNAQQSSSNIISDRQYRWKMVTTWPPNFPVVGEGAVMFAEMVEKMSAGRLAIKVYGAGELVPALECFDTVRTGAAEMASGAAYYWSGKLPAAQFFSTVPFGMNAQQMNAWIINGEGWDLWKEMYAPYNLLPMPFGNTGVQMGGWFNRKINSIADFKGLKMRMPGLGGRVLERAGGTPVLLAGGEIYTGLERGILDATEWIGPYHDYLMGFHQIAKYYYTPGWHEPGTVLELIINKAQYEQLPTDLQEIIRVAALAMNHWILSEFEAKNNQYLSIIQNEAKVEILRFPEQVLDTLKEITVEIIKEFAQRDALSQKVYASFEDFRTKAAKLSELTEKVFYNDIQTEI
jgi:TRAP-type mannitol/chloroaromatic compound transport system substrate-binding protein